MKQQIYEQKTTRTARKLNCVEQKQTKQTTRTGTESQKWRSDAGLSVRRGSEKNGGKGTGNKKHKW